MPTVYLIHFESSLSHAKHYLGYTALETAQERLDRHKSGNGARILLECNRRGIDYAIVRTWDCATVQSARKLELQLKHQKNSPRLCPVCNPKLWILQSDSNQTLIK